MKHVLVRHIWQIPRKWVVLRRSSLGALVISMSALAAFLVPSAASATTDAAATVRCSGSSCNNTDPASTGCSATATTVKEVEAYEADGSGIAVGYIDLRYSTACRTTWARFVAFYPSEDGEIDGAVSLVRNSDGRSESCQAYNTSFSSTLDGYTCYTDQLYDGGVTSYASGYVYDPSSGLVTNVVRTGSY